MRLSHTFQRFFASEQASGGLLLMATVLALLVASSPLLTHYQAFWHVHVFGLSLEHWVNDGLMAIFFLLIGLELERELYVGELSRFSHALLPIIAAIGGMAMPALCHVLLNQGTPTQAGVGIPMATDIAFALAVLSVFGPRVPPALKVFLVAFAVMDDLGAAVMIALFYSAKIQLAYLVAALVVWAVLVVFNRCKVETLWPYVLGGALMWWLTLQSGVHATLAGIALAFAIPFTASHVTRTSPSYRLEHSLHFPVALLILPLFAFANTGVAISAQAVQSLISHPNSVGIIVGLLVGKPLGVMLASRLAVAIGWCQLPQACRWSYLLGAGMLGGIGFTMSIFITNLAFADQAAMINDAKLAILAGSLLAAGVGWLHLNRVLPVGQSQ